MPLSQYIEDSSSRYVTSMTLERCVHSMAFNQDGSLLALAGEAPRIRIWPAHGMTVSSTAKTSRLVPDLDGNPAPAGAAD